MSAGKVFPDCESVFGDCGWSGRRMECCDVFKRTMSSSGLCFIFNSYSTKKAMEVWCVMLCLKGRRHNSSAMYKRDQSVQKEKQHSDSTTELHGETRGN